jgi:hypothetical protein
VSKEAAAMCYSYRDRQVDEEIRRTMQEREDRRRREEQAKKDEKERAADKDRELVRA